MWGMADTPIRSRRLRLIAWCRRGPTAQAGGDRPAAEEINLRRRRHRYRHAMPTAGGRRYGLASRPQGRSIRGLLRRQVRLLPRSGRCRERCPAAHPRFAPAGVPRSVARQPELPRARCGRHPRLRLPSEPGDVVIPLTCAAGTPVSGGAAGRRMCHLCVLQQSQGRSRRGRTRGTPAVAALRAAACLYYNNPKGEVEELGSAPSTQRRHPRTSGELNSLCTRSNGCGILPAAPSEDAGCGAWLSLGTSNCPLFLKHLE